MRVTRYINGNKIANPLNEKTIIKNDLISTTIQRVNRRIKNNVEIITDITEENKL